MLFYKFFSFFYYKLFFFTLFLFKLRLSLNFFLLMRKYPILYFKLLFIFSFILFLIFFDKINKMRIIIIFFFIFYFIFIKADSGANPHAINILDKILFIMDKNSYFFLLLLLDCRVERL